MKISHLQANLTPSSATSVTGTKFSRGDEILESSVGTSVAGGVASVAQPVGKMQKRAGSLFKGKTTKKPFYEQDAAISSIAQGVSEATLSEEDFILLPGQGHKLKPGLVSKRPDHEVEMARTDLYQSAKNAKQICDMLQNVSEMQGLDGWVQAKITKASDYLNSVRQYLEGKQHESVAEGLSWTSLDEGLSMEDKMTIFEEYHTKGSLTESIDDDKKDYFLSLDKLSDSPVKNKMYIAVPLSLVGNRILPLDTPNYMKFLGQKEGRLVFNTVNGRKTYPSKTIRDLSVFNTFTFLSASEYDKFRNALALKFDTYLPNVTKQPKSNEGVAEGSLTEGQYEMMMRNGRVKKFIAKDDADAKRIAAGHGAKSVIKLRGGVPAGKIAEQGVAEGFGQEFTVQQLATISDEALDNAYGYGRSSPGNSFGWQANLMSAAYAKKMIDAGVTDIEQIADAIHKGWNVTAHKFVQNPDQFDDTEKLRHAGKLDAKLQQRAKLMKINYAELDNEEQEKDRVVARALLQAVKGRQGMAEGEVTKTPSGIKHKATDKYGAGEDPSGFNQKYARDLTSMNKSEVKRLDTAYGVKWKNHGSKGVSEDSSNEDPCWKDYRQLGTKKKNGKTVPNCVPKKK